MLAITHYGEKYCCVYLPKNLKKYITKLLLIITNYFLKNPKKSQKIPKNPTKIPPKSKKIQLFKKSAYALINFFEYYCVIINHKVLLFNNEK